MSAVETLLAAFRDRLRVPWKPNEPAAGRVWMLWYAKEHERRIRGRFGEFRLAALDAGKTWHELDLAPLFPEWITAQPWFERAAKRPATLPTVLGQFEAFAKQRVREALLACGPDSILAITGVASLFGLMRAQALITGVAGSVPGRLLVAFPGAHRAGIYRLLDARDGYDYLAVPIPSDDVV